MNLNFYLFAIYYFYFSYFIFIVNFFMNRKSNSSSLELILLSYSMLTKLKNFENNISITIILQDST